MLVVLQNLTRRPLTLVLPHEAACTERLCLCERMADPTAPHAAKLRVPASVQLFAAGRPGDSSGPLPALVSRAPDVAAAVRRGEVALRETASELPPAPELAPLPPEPAARATDAAPVELNLPAPEPAELEQFEAQEEPEPKSEQPARRGRKER